MSRNTQFKIFTIFSTILNAKFSKLHKLKGLTFLVTSSTKETKWLSLNIITLNLNTCLKVFLVWLGIKGLPAEKIYNCLDRNISFESLQCSDENWNPVQDFRDGKGRGLHTRSSHHAKRQILSLALGMLSSNIHWLSAHHLTLMRMTESWACDRGATSTPVVIKYLSNI